VERPFAGDVAGGGVMSTPQPAHRLSMDEGPDEHTPAFCVCGAWWPCPEAPKDQPLEPWEIALAEVIFGDD
jgi:hypothetical protein